MTALLALPTIGLLIGLCAAFSDCKTVDSTREERHSPLTNEGGQDIVEYAVMLAVILVIVLGTVQLIGTGASHTFSSVASAMQ